MFTPNLLAGAPQRIHRRRRAAAVIVLALVAGVFGMHVASAAKVPATASDMSAVHSHDPCHDGDTCQSNNLHHIGALCAMTLLTLLIAASVLRLAGPVALSPPPVTRSDRSPATLSLTHRRPPDLNSLSVMRC